MYDNDDDDDDDDDDDESVSVCPAAKEETKKIATISTPTSGTKVS